jgi:uncharacterized membrane protein
MSIEASGLLRKDGERMLDLVTPSTPTGLVYRLLSTAGFVIVIISLLKIEGSFSNYKFFSYD